MGKTLRSLSLGLIVTCLLAGQAAADGEQWLMLRSAGETGQFTGGAWSQRLMPTPDKPPDVKLPAFAGESPLFAQWQTPMTPAGHVWLAFDQSAKAGAYDVLYVDSNADGQLADEKPLRADQTDARDNYASAEFKLAKVLLSGDDGPTAYHLNVTYSQRGGDRTVRAEPGCWYEGPVKVAGRDLWCTLIDFSSNGRFNDTGANRSQCDRIRIAPKGDLSFRDQEGDTTTSFVGRYVEVDGTLYELEASPDGAYVKLTPAQAPRGTIQLGKTVTAFSVFGLMGHFQRTGKDGAADVPAGQYMTDRYEVALADSGGVTWQVRENGAGREKPFTVEAGKTVTLNIGEPFRCELSATKRSGGYSFSHSLTTPRGDMLSLRRNGQRPPAPQVHIVNADKSYDKTFRMEYG